MSQVIALVLAAGGSTRMGRCKALLPLDGTPLVVCHVDALQKGCARVRVVVGDNSEDVRRVLPPDVEVVTNEDWATTETRHSILLGIEDLPDDATVVVTPVDTPPVPASVLRALLAVGGPAVPEHLGAPGHPVVVGCEAARRGLSVRPLCDVLAGARPVPVLWSDTRVSFNTPEEWERWCASRSREHP